MPPGTEYHWYILGHQTATKLDANDYETRTFGLEYKLAHKRADKSAWSASERAQARRRVEVASSRGPRAPARAPRRAEASRGASASA